MSLIRYTLETVIDKGNEECTEGGLLDLQMDVDHMFQFK